MRGISARLSFADTVVMGKRVGVEEVKAVEKAPMAPTAATAVKTSNVLLVAQRFAGLLQGKACAIMLSSGTV